MPTTTTTPTNPSALPPAAIRAQISTKMDEFVHTLLSHRLMRQQTPHKTLYHVWDFAMRTKYILSELDNVEAVRHVTSFRGFWIPAESNVSKAKECMEDVFTRSLTLELMSTDVNPEKMTMMGLEKVDFGEEVKVKSKAVMAAFDPIDTFE